MSKLIIGNSMPIPAKVVEKEVPLPFSVSYQVIDGVLYPPASGEAVTVWPNPKDMRGVTDLGDGVFVSEGKSWTIEQRTALTKIDLSSLTRVTGLGALYDTFYTGNYPNVTEIDCSNLVTIDGTTATSYDSTPMTYTFSNLHGPTATGNELTLNFNSLENMIGRYVGYNMFHGCRDLYHVNFPKLKQINSTQDGVYTAGYYMFTNTPQLIDAKFESLETINGSSSLFGATNASTASKVQSIYMPNLKLLKNTYNMFRHCTNLSDITLGTSDLVIENPSFGINSPGCIFGGCTSLTSINLNSLVKVGYKGLYYGFSDCINLSQISLQNLKTVDLWGCSNLFEDCRALTEVHFDSLCSVEQSAFNNAFCNCTNLTDLYFPKLSFPCERGRTNSFYRALYGVDGCTVHFPKNMLTIVEYSQDEIDSFLSNLIYGSTNTVILFDLPELKTTTITVLYDANQIISDLEQQMLYFSQEVTGITKRVGFSFDQEKNCGSATFEILNIPSNFYIYKYDTYNYTEGNGIIGYYSEFYKELPSIIDIRESRVLTDDRVKNVKICTNIKSSPFLAFNTYMINSYGYGEFIKTCNLTKATSDNMWAWGYFTDRFKFDGTINPDSMDYHWIDFSIQTEDYQEPYIEIDFPIKTSLMDIQGGSNVLSYCTDTTLEDGKFELLDTVDSIYGGSWDNILKFVNSSDYTIAAKYIPINGETFNNYEYFDGIVDVGFPKDVYNGYKAYFYVALVGGTNIVLNADFFDNPQLGNFIYWYQMWDGDNYSSEIIPDGKIGYLNGWAFGGNMTALRSTGWDGNDLFLLIGYCRENTIPGQNDSASVYLQNVHLTVYGSN